MATHNGARHIAAALESLFAQSRPPEEIVVIDDGSTDGTFDRIQTYLPRLLYHRQEHLGVAAARNAAMGLGSGSLVAFLDSDDWYLPHHLESLREAFCRDPGLGMAVSGWRRMAQDGTRLADAEPWRRAPRLDLRTWLVHKPVFPGAMMVRREWLEQVRGFDESLAVSPMLT
jgi:glycosyltransferase involved in cell wall biosynthesis